MKSLTAILFSVLLVWMQIASAPVSAAPVCAKPAMAHCPDCCRAMACCAEKPGSNSQRAPVVPASSHLQNQIPLLALTMAIWMSPKNPSAEISSGSTSSLTAKSVPLHQRNCIFLI